MSEEAEINYELICDDSDYAKGVRYFSNDGRDPYFVHGRIVITPKILLEWAERNKNILSLYNGELQVILQVLPCCRKELESLKLNLIKLDWRACPLIKNENL